jgi:hypothetical protein
MRRLSQRKVQVSEKRIAKKRQQLVRALEWSAVPERPFMGRGPRYLVHPTVTAACAPALRAIAAAVREERVLLDEGEIREVRNFLRDGSSPFFRRDIAAAQQEAERLRDHVLGVEAVAVDDVSLAIAV